MTVDNEADAVMSEGATYSQQPSALEEKKAASGESERRTRPQESKAAKAAKKKRLEMVEENNLIKDTLESWTVGLTETNQASVDATNENEKKSAKFKEKGLEVMKVVAELDTVKILFSGNDVDSVRYREALQRKRLQKILEFQKESSN